MAWDSDNESSVKEFFGPVRRRWVWVLLPVVLLPIVVTLASRRQVVMYEASATVVTAESPVEASFLGRDNDVSRRQRKMRAEVEFARGDRVLGALEDGADFDSELLILLNVVADLDSDVLTFTAQTTTAQSASDTVNSWAGHYVRATQERDQQVLNKTIDELVATVARVQGERQELLNLGSPGSSPSVRNGAAGSPQVAREVAQLDSLVVRHLETIERLEFGRDIAAASAAQLTDAADPPKSQTTPLAAVRVVVAVFIAAFIGLGLTMFVDRLDSTVGGSADIHRLGLAVLGEVPEASNRLSEDEVAAVMATDPASPMADGYRRLATAIRFGAVDHQVDSILVTSPGYQEGKTTTAVNVALANVSVGSRTVLADVHALSPRLARIFGLDGLLESRSASTNGALGHPIAVTHPALGDRDEVAVLPVRHREAGDAGTRQASLEPLIRDLRRSSDILVLDGPPVLPSADSLVLAQLVDGVVVVARVGRTTKYDLIDAVSEVARSGGRVIGVALVVAGSKRRDRRRRDSAAGFRLAAKPAPVGVLDET